jgi:hypothetical protein
VDTEQYKARRAELEGLLAAARERVARLAEECSTHCRAIEKLDDERLSAFTDEEILATEESRRWACGLRGMGAYRRVRALHQRGLTPSLHVDGVDGRDEWVAFQLPCLRLGLERGQDTSAEAAAIRAWWELWGLGREDLPISITDRDLSAGGSWGMVWSPSLGTARVTLLRWGLREERHLGDLETSLGWVAQHAWSSDPMGSAHDY